MIIYIRAFAFILLLVFISTPLYGQMERNYKKWPPSNYLVYYGAWDEAKIDQTMEFDLVILHPGSDLENITPSLIKDIQKGRDRQEGTEDDTIVIAYISIGEDETVPRGPANIEGKGPVYFDGSLREGNNDYPTRYLDEISYVFDETGFFTYLPGGMPAIVAGHDGLPDENGIWGSFYVNPGDSEWQNILTERMEKLSEDYNVDGFFLDTLDTASPWGNYGWTQENMVLWVKKIRELFPGKFLIANRGLFLLENYGDLFSSSIDGLMFESFLTEWDWYEKKGTESPYLSENYRILKEYLLPASLESDGFHIFFLDYINPEQKDFYNILSLRQELLQDLSCTCYITSPDLQQIFPLPERYFSDEDFFLPEISDLNIEETDRGRFEIAFDLENSEEDEIVPGKDFFIDIRYGEARDISALNPLAVDYDGLENNHISIESFGLDKGKEYNFFVKLLTKNPEIYTEYMETSLNTEDGSYPGIVSGINGEGREGSVYLLWDGEESLSSYNIYMGTDMNDMKKIGVIDGNSLLIDGLEKDKPYCFSISGNSLEGEEGTLSYPLTLYPADCTPPPSPENLNVSYDKVNKQLYVSWDSVECDDLAGYMLYCFPADKGLRLPLVFPSHIIECSLENLIDGETYSLFVTAFDYNSNQSRSGEWENIFIFPHE